MKRIFRRLLTKSTFSVFVSFQNDDDSKPKLPWSLAIKSTPASWQVEVWEADSPNDLMSLAASTHETNAKAFEGEGDDSSTNDILPPSL